MKLASILDSPWTSLEHLERYVNRGSPSGFSDLWTTSSETAPRGDVPSFRLYKLSTAASTASHFGTDPGLGGALEDDAILLHPDIAKSLAHLAPVPCDSFRVSPTASGRTVHVLRDQPFHLKLHYDAVIGRLDRSLGIRQASYATYVNDVIISAVDRGVVRSNFGVLPEPYARVLTLRSASRTQEIGFVYRSLRPITGARAPSALLPAFSLYAVDSADPTDELLILQLLGRSGLSADDFLLEQFLLPLVDSYFSLLLSTGLQGEFHAQNTVFGLDSSGNICCTLLRDMESLDTDMDLRLELGIDLEEPPSLHKAINRTMKNYQIKHSFMFDHKLGEYLLCPLIDLFADRHLVDRAAIDEEVRNRVERYMKEMPSDFFPRGAWYSFDRVQIDRSTGERPYIRHSNPRFRRDMSQ